MPRVILVGDIEAVTPCEPLMAMLTIPVKPLTGTTVMVEVPEAPASRGPTVVGLALTVRSGRRLTMTTTTVEWVRLPPVPVTVTLKVPSTEPSTVSMEVPLPPRREGLSNTLMAPEEGVAPSVTRPENPFRLVIVMVELLEDPT